MSEPSGPPPADGDAELDHRRVVVRGTELHVVELGASAAPPVLLLHGWPEAWFSWRHQLRRLAAAGYRAVAPDLPGFNESTAPAHGYALDALADDLAALIDALGGRAHVVGHDWGGALAWHLAQRSPERVASLCVCNGPHPGVMERALRTSPRQLARSWYMFFFMLPWLPERWLTRRRAESVARILLDGAVDRAQFTPEVIERYRAAMLRPGAARGGLSYYRRSLRDAFVPWRRSRLLRQWRRPLQMPVTLIWADRDRMLGAELAEPHRRYAPALRLERVAACGHFCQQERPERIAQLILAHLRRADKGGAPPARPRGALDARVQ